MSNGKEFNDHSSSQHLNFPASKRISMNDFSFSGVFRAAFNTLIKNFTDIFFISVLSAASVLFISLFLNSLFLSRVNSVMGAALSASDYVKTTNPFLLFSVYAGLVLIFAALFLFFMASALLPLCKGNVMRLKNYIPSFSSAAKFVFAAVIFFAVFGFIILAGPSFAGYISAGGGYNAGVFAVSAISFALLAVFVICALKYSLFFIALLENAGLKEAFKKSKKLTNGQKMKIFVLFSLLFLINFAGKFLIFFLLVTVPFSIIAVIYVYLELDETAINN